MKNLILVFLLFGLHVLHAENVKDNPYYVLHTVSSEYAGIKAFDILALDLKLRSPKEALENIDYILELSKAKKNPTLLCAYFETLANYYSVLNDRTNAMSTKYHEEALRVAEENDLQDQIVRQLFNFGGYYFTYANRGMAYGYFRRALFLIDKYGEQNITYVWKYYIVLARYFYNIKEYDLSKEILNRTLKYHGHLEQREFFDTVNTLGLIELYQDNHKKAVSYFEKVYEEADGVLDTAWMGISYGNIGNVYAKEGQLEKAIDHFKIDYAYNIKSSGDIFSALSSLKKIAELQYKLGKYKESLRNINEYLQLMERKPARYKALSEAFDLKVQLLEQLSIQGEQLETLREFNHYSKLYTSLENQSTIDALKLEEEKDKFQTLYSTNRKYKMLSGVLLLLSLTVALTGFGFYVRYRKKVAEVKREVDIPSEPENHYDLSEILADRRSMTLHARKDIKISGRLRELLELNLLNERNWRKFKDAFNEDFPNFFTDIADNHSGLSTSDMRLLALMYLDLSNKELADKLSISLEGVKKAKQRLKKKLTDHNHFGSLQLA